MRDIPATLRRYAHSVKGPEEDDFMACWVPFLPKNLQDDDHRPPPLTPHRTPKLKDELGDREERC